MNIADEARLHEEIERLRTALIKAQRAEARAKQRNSDLVEAVYQAARDAQLATPPVKVTAAKKDKRRTSGETALLHLTDWQAGKNTISYDLPTLAKRIDAAVDKTATLTEIQRAHHPVKHCVLILGGDMVEGLTVFPGQVYEVEATLFQQLFAVSTLIEQTVRRLVTMFESVHVVCEYGNHGRLGRRGDMPAADNVDRMAYQIAADKCSDLPATWQQSSSWYQVLSIGNYRALVVHGDEIPSFGGQTPAFSILRKCNAWATGVVEPFTDVYMGHFHTPMSLTMANGGRVFVTGSPESGNEYARAFVAAVGRPSQRLHFVHGERGIVTTEHTLWLD